MNTNFTTGFDHLNNARIEGYRVTYYAPETGLRYRVSREDVEDLGRRLLAEEPDAYSNWCSDTFAEEV